jgi:ketosteroid isomerase-like protein
MYHAFVRHRLREVFAALSRADDERVLSGMAAHFEHTFSGSHPLGGTRHSLPALRRWFERLRSLNKQLAFTVKHIAVSGGPWDTTAVVEWRDTATLANGSAYVNDGSHVVRIRWGRVVSLHAYLDTEVFANACRAMAAAGIPEASCAPIED